MLPSSSKRAFARAPLQKHQRREAHDLRLGGKQAQQQADQPDRFLGQRLARLGLAAVVRGIPLVEQQVDHRGHDRETLRPLRRTRCLEGDAGIADARLGPRDALLHGGLAHQEGLRDLLHRQAADDAQRQRDLLRRRQLRMAADEQQPQDVVLVVLAVEPVGQRRLGIVEIRQHRLVRQFRLLRLPADLIHRGIAADQDQPGGGIARRAVLRPVLQRAQAGLLEGFLGRIEIPEVAQQRAHHLRAGRAENRIDPAEVVHAAGFFASGSWLGWNSATGRIS